MARKALIVKHQRLWKDKFENDGKKKYHKVRFYNRCALCGRTRGYMRDFGVCRVCFRKYAREGMIMGVKKSSW